jgi:hypothetical protein
MNETGKSGISKKNPAFEPDEIKKAGDGGGRIPPLTLLLFPYFNLLIPRALRIYFSNNGSLEPFFILLMKYFSKATESSS